jgi:hypothetical protein
MVAINFTMFKDKIAAREKRMTIRKTPRAKRGDRIQLYTGMRTKACRKLVDDDAVCIACYPVRISDGAFELTTGDDYDITDYLYGPGGLNEKARADGFDDWDDMKAFFRKTYGLPFTGYAHVWDWPDDRAVKGEE